MPAWSARSIVGRDPVIGTKIADGQSEKLDWQQSIADLMKLLKLDSSLTARKQLAQELGYKGSLDGSAEMNLWLHKEVMTKLAGSGGVVPESLKAGRARTAAAGGVKGERRQQWP